MKLLIDLSEDVYTRICSGDNAHWEEIDEFFSDISTTLTAIRQGETVPNKQNRLYLTLEDKRQLLNNPPKLTQGMSNEEYAKHCYDYGAKLKEVFGIETHNEYVMYRDLINRDWKDICKCTNIR